MTQVSGPINLIRMEGDINGIHKVFYLFMDIHVDSHNQTECMDARSVHIKNYLVNIFDQLKNTNKTVDFFLETFPDASTNILPYTDIYIIQLRTMFELIFKFNFKENKVVKSKEFPNVRMHYIDIRPFLTFTVGNPFSIAWSIGNHIYSLEGKFVFQKDIIDIKNGLNMLNSQLLVLFNAIFKEQNKIKKVNIIRQYPPATVNYEEEEGTKIITYLMNKIKNDYNHKNVKNGINQILDNKIKKLYDEYVDVNNKFLTYLDEAIKKINFGFRDKIKYREHFDYFGYQNNNISREIFTGLQKHTDILENIVNDINLLVMDLYFLRRTLDKDYVTNSVVYTGARHSAHYIGLLAKYFDFKITHVHYADNNINDLNNKIKQLDTAKDILDLFIPPKLYQCIDVSNFPKNFS